MIQQQKITNLPLDVIVSVCMYRMPGEGPFYALHSYVKLASLNREHREGLFNEQVALRELFDVTLGEVQLDYKGLSSKTVAGFMAKIARLTLINEQWRPLVYKALAKYDIYGRFYDTILRQDTLRLFDSIRNKIGDLGKEHMIPLYLHATLMYYYGTRESIEIIPFDNMMWQTYAHDNFFVYVPREKSHDYEEWGSIPIKIDGQDRTIDLCRLWPLEMTRLLPMEKELYLVLNYPPALEGRLRYKVQCLGHNYERHVFFAKCSRLVRQIAQETLDTDANIKLFNHYVQEAIDK